MKILSLNILMLGAYPKWGKSGFPAPDCPTWLPKSCRRAMWRR